MANLKFSQFTEQTDTANVQFLVGYNGSTNVRIAPGNVSSLGGSGTLNTIAMFTPDGNTLGNSLITISNIGTVSETINSTSKVFQIGTAISGDFAQLNLLSPGAEGIIDTLGSGDLVLRTNSSATNQFRLKDTGALQAKAYGSGTFTGTAAYTLSVDSSGNIIETTAGGGGSGTVTSVATPHAGNAFPASIGNVSTVNPSVDITLNGSASQYIDGAGNLTTFPTITTGTVESVGLSMPAAFSVASSPVTTSGTLTVTGAGTTAQYIRGDGTLNTFPTIPTVPANIVETVTTTDGTFINLTPNTATDGAVTVTADLSATGTPNSSSYLRGDNTWATIPGGFTSFDITGGSGSAQTITNGNTVTLAQGTGISTVAGATDTVTITNTLPFNSLTLAGDSGASQSITNNNTITLAGGTGLSSVASATDTVTFNANVDGTQSVAANTSTTTAARTYKVQVDSSDNLVVNVPWTSGSGGIGGSIANAQVAFGNSSGEIEGENDFTYNSTTNTVGVEKLIATDNITVGQEIYHSGDTDTYIQFTTDTIKFVAGAKSMIESTTFGSPDRVVINEAGQDIDFRVEGFGGGSSFTHLLYVDAFLQKVGINQAVPAYTFDVVGDAKISGTIVDSTNSAGSNNDVLTSTGTGWSWQPASGGAAYPFSTDGVNSLYSGFVPTGTLTGTENTILGIDAGASISSNALNTLIGYKAGFSGAVGFTGNTVVGMEAFDAATSCTYNTVIGFRAGSAATTVVNQAVFIGYNAGFTAANSTAPTAIGSGCMQNATGTFSVGVGYNAFSQAAGAFAVAIGGNAGYSGGGSYGTHVGYQAGRNVTGGYNVCIGRNAGYTGSFPITSGARNTLVGTDISTSSALLSRATVIGYGASDNGDNTVTLGGSTVTGLHCQVQTISALSDSRDKTNIQKSSYGLDVIEKLNPVTFEWDQRDGNRKGLKDLGFIAQELQESGDEYLQLVNSNDPEKLQASYSRLIPVMIKAIQELQEEIKYLKNK